MHRNLIFALALSASACDHTFTPEPFNVYVELSRTIAYNESGPYCIVTWKAESEAQHAERIAYVLFVNDTVLMRGTFYTPNSATVMFHRSLGMYDLRWQFYSVYANDYASWDRVTGIC